MKGRLRFILSLLLLCLLGIYGFQAYWLYGSYQLARAGFARTTREALEAVVQQQQLRRANKVLRFVLDDRQGPAIRIKAGKAGGVDSFIRLRAVPMASVKARIDSLRAHAPADSTARLHTTVIHPHNQQLRLSLPPASLVQSVQIQATKHRADSLARRLSGLIVSSWEHSAAVNLPQLSRLYRTELRRRGVAVAFQLDTVAATGLAGTRVHVSGNSGTGRSGLLPDWPGYSARTPTVPINPLRELSVVASFPAPTGYVLRRMGSSLAGSALLLALTTSCFALMLSTILRQKKLAEVKNDFINNMTHELKTPLATVSAAVEALQDFGALHDPRRATDYLTIARQELTRLSGLVENVLRIAAEERHGRVLTLHPEPTTLGTLVAELVSRHKLQAPKPVQFDVHIPPTATLPLDRLHLTGALHNLFDNAIKYSGPQVRVHVQAQPVAGGWQLTVADDGVGIAPGYQTAVFEQFFRVPTGNLHPVKGFGLGLYYARQVVASHGGRISLRSEVGYGSEFTLWLPGGA